MMIERFAAEDMNQAMRLVKAKLGAEAVILANERKGDLVEVLAAADYDEAILNGAGLDDNELQSNSVSVAPLNDNATIELQEELRTLRLSLQAEIAELRVQSAVQQTVRNTRSLVGEKLNEIGLSKDVVSKLTGRIPEHMTKVPSWTGVLKLLGSVVRTGNNDILDQGGIVALVGSTGVGKTTTVAKLAAQFSAKHGAEQVAIITTDQIRIGGQEQLTPFARQMQIPLAKVANAGELTQALQEFQQRKLILIDTAGMGQKDIELARHLVSLNQTSFEIKNYLVLSATSQLGLTQEVIKAFHMIPLHGAVITKTDEALNLGSALSGVIRNRLPVTYVCDGQNVPDDIEAANRDALMSDVSRMRREMNENQSQLESQYG